MLSLSHTHSHCHSPVKKLVGKTGAAFPCKQPQQEGHLCRCGRRARTAANSRIFPQGSDLKQKWNCGVCGVRVETITPFLLRLVGGKKDIISTTAPPCSPKVVSVCWFVGAFCTPSRRGENCETFWNFDLPSARMMSNNTVEFRSEQEKSWFDTKRFCFRWQTVKVWAKSAFVLVSEWGKTCCEKDREKHPRSRKKAQKSSFEPSMRHDDWRQGNGKSKYSFSVSFNLFCSLKKKVLSNWSQSKPTWHTVKKQ